MRRTAVRLKAAVHAGGGGRSIRFVARPAEGAAGQPEISSMYRQDHSIFGPCSSRTGRRSARCRRGADVRISSGIRNPRNASSSHSGPSNDHEESRAAAAVAGLFSSSWKAVESPGCAAAAPDDSQSQRETGPANRLATHAVNGERLPSQRRQKGAVADAEAATYKDPKTSDIPKNLRRNQAERDAERA